MNTYEQKVARQIGLNIKVLRTRLEMSQAELAEKAQSKASYISEIENGKHNVSLVTLIKLAASLKCGLEDMVKGTPNPLKRK